MLSSQASKSEARVTKLKRTHAHTRYEIETHTRTHGEVHPTSHTIDDEMRSYTLWKRKRKRKRPLSIVRPMKGKGALPPGRLSCKPTATQ